MLAWSSLWKEDTESIPAGSMRLYGSASTIHILWRRNSSKKLVCVVVVVVRESVLLDWTLFSVRHPHGGALLVYFL